MKGGYHTRPGGSFEGCITLMNTGKRLLLLGSLALASGCGSSAIPESSGLAPSHRYPGAVWTHNDGPNVLSAGGGDSRLYLLDENGAIRASVVVNAPNTDWEDIAAFRQGGEGYLLIAAVGDNAEAREVYELHALIEPREGEAMVEPAWTLRFRFPDGSHDCEAVAVDPVEQAVILVTKRALPAGVYRLPLGPGGPEVVTAERLGSLWALPRPSGWDKVRNPFQGAYTHQPTGLDISADGRRAVIATYDNAYLWHRAEGVSWGETFATPPLVVELPGIRQYEGVAFSRDGEAIVVSREGSTALLQVPLPVR